MIIGYDGKRAFQNKTGLGNYSRSLLGILSAIFPTNRYILFAPRQTDLLKTTGLNNVEVIVPKTSFYRRFPALWRRRGMVKDVIATKPDIYHGLSNELPIGIENTGVKAVVTVHDLIFERFPGTYNFDERYVHRWKIRRACKVANAVIAISGQTKQDLEHFYGVDPGKIFICYQSCNPIFANKVSSEQAKAIKEKYGLPDKYFLFVSSIAPRKNLLLICKAMAYLNNKLHLPLVVIGDGKKEKDQVKSFMSANQLSDRLVLLNEHPLSKAEAFISGNDFPAFYQMATALVYPSIFEGFGLPILEAMWSGLPVICSDNSSLPEVAGEAALYFDPGDHKALAERMLAVATNNVLSSELRNKGFEQAKKFAPEKYAESIMNVYNQLL